jgi:membrane-bound lytic murein transglycosylase B
VPRPVRWLLWSAIVFMVALLGAGLVAGDLLLVRASRNADTTAVAAYAAATPAPPAGGPGRAAGSTPDISDWARQVASATGLPVAAVQAYGLAQLSLAASRPGCHLSWNTLAGIATVESDNGQYGGARITGQGVETVPIIGVPLNGAPGQRTVADTDHGTLDGDPVYDHAVGPFQFLPATWRRFAPRGSDPQNIDVAAVAAGRYLCAAGRDLTRGPDWQAAVLAYNDSGDYVAQVLRFADQYARAAP